MEIFKKINDTSTTKTVAENSGTYIHMIQINKCFEENKPNQN